MGVSVSTVYKRVKRWKAEREVGLVDRSSRPHRSPRRLPRHRRRQVDRLRRKGWSTPRIARGLKMPVSKIGADCRRLGLGRLKALAPPPPVIRYERKFPGELLHIEIKKLRRIGRVGYCIHSIGHLFPRPCTPRTHGKAERFIRTVQEEWAYAQPYGPSNERTATLSALLSYYNCGRHHGGIQEQTPQQRLSELTVNKALERHRWATVKRRSSSLLWISVLIRW